jgi:hypothetical protein
MSEISFQSIQNEIFSAWQKGKSNPIQLDRFNFDNILGSLKEAARKSKSQAVEVRTILEISAEDFRDSLVKSLEELIRNHICGSIYPTLDEVEERERFALALVRTTVAMLPEPYKSVVALIEPLLLFLVCGALEIIIVEGMGKYCSAQTVSDGLLFRVDGEDATGTLIA